MLGPVRDRAPRLSGDPAVRFPMLAAEPPHLCGAPRRPAVPPPRGCSPRACEGRRRRGDRRSSSIRRAVRRSRRSSGPRRADRGPRIPVPSGRRDVPGSAAAGLAGSASRRPPAVVPSRCATSGPRPVAGRSRGHRAGRPHRRCPPGRGPDGRGDRSPARPRQRRGIDPPHGRRYISSSASGRSASTPAFQAQNAIPAHGQGAP